MLIYFYNCACLLALSLLATVAKYLVKVVGEIAHWYWKCGFPEKILAVYQTMMKNKYEIEKR